MPDVLPTINNEPAQGIQALLDTTYLWNPDVANDLIEQINALLEKLDGVTGSIPPYSELEAPVKQYQPCYNGDNVYVAAADMETLPATFNPAQWILIATKAPVLQAGAGIDINGNEISVEQQVLSDAAAGGTAVQPEDLATVATSGSYTDLSNKPAIDGVTLTSQTTKADIGLAGVYKYKGSVATYADLANVQNPDVGDVYNVEDTGDNYAWSGTEWDQLGGTFVAPVTSVNSKTGTVVLSAKDVGAIPQYSTMPTVDSSILGETVQYVGATDANYTNGYFYKASGTAPSSPVFYYNNNDIEITDPTAFINTVNANVGGGLQVVDGSLMQIDAYTDRNNDWAFDIYLENPNGSGGYTDTEYCGFTTSSLASVGITESSQGTDRFSVYVAYTTSTEPQIYSSWPGGFLIVNPQQFISFASNILGGASPVGDTVSVWMAGSSGSETYDFVYVIGNADEGTIYQEDYTFTESEFESNLGLRILDPYAEVDFSPVTEGTTPTYAWVRVDVQPAPEALPDQTGHSGEFLTTDGAGASWAAVDALPSQTGQSGKFLTTDGTDASWSDKPLVNNATGSQSIGIGQYQYQTSGSNSIAIGDHSGAIGDRSVALGSSARGDTNYTVSVGAYANLHYGTVQSKNYSTAVGASAMSKGLYSVSLGCTAVTEATGGIQLGYGTNSNASTLSVGLVTSTSPFASSNYELLSSDGTIPTARFTADPVSDGTYVPTLTITSGVATRSWSAPSGGLPSQTGNSGKFLTTDGTDASWSDKPIINKAVQSNSVVINTNPNSTTVQAGGQNNTMLGYGARVNNSSANYNTIIGQGANVSGSKNKNVTVGYGSESYADNCTTIGSNARANANNAIQIGNIDGGTALNSDANTMKVANANGNFEMMSADGTIPTARFTADPVSDGAYIPTVTLSSGTATRSWEAPTTITFRTWGANE